MITGATGYIGSNLTKKLVLEGNDVHVILRPSSDTGLLNDIINHVNIHILNNETHEIIELLKEVQPHFVIHLAALFTAEHKTEDIRPIIESNILFGVQLLQAAASTGVKIFINTGTHWQNSNGCGYNPANLYAASKQAFECMAGYYTEVYDMRMLTLKLIDTYGPFDHRTKIMNLFKRIADSGEILGMTPGNQQMGLVYIDDVIKGFIASMELVENMQPHQQHSCIVAPDRFYSLKEVAAIFEDVSGKHLNIEWGKRAYRAREIMEVRFCEPNILNGYNTYSLHEGIELMLEKERAKL